MWTCIYVGARPGALPRRDTPQEGNTTRRASALDNGQGEQRTRKYARRGECAREEEEKEEERSDDLQTSSHHDSTWDVRLCDANAPAAGRAVTGGRRTPPPWHAPPAHHTHHTAHDGKRRKTCARAGDTCCTRLHPLACPPSRARRRAILHRAAAAPPSPPGAGGTCAHARTHVTRAIVFPHYQQAIPV